MSSVRLTKREVTAAKPKAARYTIFDTEIPGFGLHVFPSGQKSWVLEYRPGEAGRRVAKKRIKIGGVDELTPDEARKRADLLRSRVKVGEDPQAEVSAKRRGLTLAELAALFLEEHVHAKRKPNTQAAYADVLNRLVVPALGTIKAERVKAADVARLHHSLRLKPIMANKVVAVLGSLYGFAGRRGLVPEGCSPARRIDRYPEQRRETFLSMPQLECLGAALHEAETTGLPWAIDSANAASLHLPKDRQQTVVSPYATAAIRLLVFTGARLREILHLEWKHVDHERGLLLLPDSKTGRKTSKQLHRRSEKFARLLRA